MILSERMRARMEALNVSQSKLARQVGVTQGTVAHLASGRSSSSVHLPKIARELQTTVAYLTGQTDDPSEGAFVPPSPEEIAEQMGLMKVEEIDLAIGMGATYLDDQSVQSIERWIPADWLRNFTDSPASFLTIAKPVGDSMYPTINDRDIVLIDRSQRIINRQDAIWALSFGGLGTIKRVRAMPDGTMKLMADNPHVREETAVESEVFVIGRVAGVFRRT